jgi:hypothetical protein
MDLYQPMHWKYLSFTYSIYSTNLSTALWRYVLKDVLISDIFTHYIIEKLMSLSFPCVFINRFFIGFWNILASLTGTTIA